MDLDPAPENELVPMLSRQGVLARIERLAISADAKALLLDLAEFTIDVGGRLVQAGRKILSFIFDLVRRFPNTTFAAIAAYVVTALLASVPLLGPVLAVVAGPLLVALGITFGALADLKERAFVSRVERLEREFNALGPVRQ